MALKPGVKVAWVSQSGGNRTKKVGHILVVVAPKTKPPAAVKTTGRCRDHESYIVEVFKDPVAQTGRRLHWPRTSALVRV
jgi:hypothetical protein